MRQVLIKLCFIFCFAFFSLCKPQDEQPQTSGNFLSDINEQNEIDEKTMQIIGLCQGCEDKILNAVHFITNPFVVLLTACSLCHVKQMFLTFLRRLRVASHYETIQDKKCQFFDRIISFFEGLNFFIPSHKRSLLLVGAREVGPKKEEVELGNRQTLPVIPSLPLAASSELPEDNIIG